MVASLLPLTLAVLLAADAPAKSETPRKPHPLAPSLPELTDEKEGAFDRVVERFIDYDTGRLRGPDGKQALADFHKLPPESIFALIRGVNRSADIEASCPVVTIARKINSILRSSNDPELLEFARENIGAGVTKQRHLGVIRDLRVAAMLRRRDLGSNAVVARPRPSAAPPSRLQTKSLGEVLAEGGTSKDQLNRELDRRPRDRVLAD